MAFQQTYGSMPSAGFSVPRPNPSSAYSPRSANTQRAHDMHILMGQLNQMDALVRTKADAFQASESGSYPGYGGIAQPSFDSTSSFSSSGLSAGNLNSEQHTMLAAAKAAAASIPVGPVMPITNEALMPIMQGTLFRKEAGGALGGRQWKERWVRVEGTDLAFYDKQGAARPRDKWPLFSTTTYTAGARAKGKAVKAEFDIRNEGSTEPLALYAATEDQAMSWIDTIAHIVDALKEADKQGKANIVAAQAAQAAVLAAQAAAGVGTTGGAALSAEMGSLLANLTGTLSGLQGHLSQAAALSASVDAAAANAYVLPPELSHFLPQDLDSDTLQILQEEAACQQAYGPGLYEGVKGDPSSFFIQSVDAQGVPKSLGGDTFHVSLEPVALSDIRMDIAPVDNGDGTYFVEYTPTRVGSYSLRVTYYGQEINGSPFALEVAAAPTAPNRSVIEGTGATLARAGVMNTFCITTRDAYDEVRGVGGDNFEISVSGPAVVSPIIDNGDGTYTVSYEVDTTAAEYLTAAGRYGVWQTGGSGPPPAPFTLLIRIVLNNPGFAYPRQLNGMPLRPVIEFGEQRIAAAVPSPAPAASNQASSSPAGAPPPPPPPPAQPTVTVATPAPAPVAIPAPVVVDAVPAPAPAPATAAISLLSSPTAPSPPRPAPIPLKAYDPEDDPAVLRLRAELVERERQAREQIARLDEDKKKLDEQRAIVEKQMLRMQELGRKVKQDAESLAEQTKALREAQALAASANAAQQQATALAYPSSPRAQSRPDASSPAPASVSRGGALPLTQPDFAASGVEGGSQAPVFDGEASGMLRSAVAGSATAPSFLLVPPFDVPSPAPAAGGAPVPAAASSSAGESGYLQPQPAPPQALMGLEAPAELFEPDVMGLFERHRKALSAVWTYYTSLTGLSEGIDSKRWVELYADYDVCPTFLTKRELRAIFGAASTAHAGGALPDDPSTAPPLTYAAFMEAMGRTALVALSKPAFAHLYQGAAAKVQVLLEMWGMADPRKLGEVQRRPRPVAGPSSVAGKSRASTVDTRGTPRRRKVQQIAL